MREVLFFGVCYSGGWGGGGRDGVHDGGILKYEVGIGWHLTMAQSAGGAQIWPLYIAGSICIEKSKNLVNAVTLLIRESRESMKKF